MATVPLALLWRNDRKDPPFPQCDRALRPLRLRPRLYLTIHLKIHALVKEAQVALYLPGFRDRLLIAPDEILHVSPPSLHRPVRCDTLVRALRLRITGDEPLLADVFRGDIVACR